MFATKQRKLIFHLARSLRSEIWLDRRLVFVQKKFQEVCAIFHKSFDVRSLFSSCNISTRFIKLARLIKSSKFTTENITSWVRKLIYSHDNDCKLKIATIKSSTPQVGRLSHAIDLTGIYFRAYRIGTLKLSRFECIVSRVSTPGIFHRS